MTLLSSQLNHSSVRLTAVSMKMTVFWDAAP